MHRNAQRRSRKYLGNLRFYKVFATVELFTLAHEVSGNDKGLQGLLRAKILGNTRIYCNVAKGICKKEIKHGKD